MTSCTSDPYGELELAAAVVRKTSNKIAFIDRMILTVHWTLTDEEDRIVGLCRWMTTSPNSLWI